MFLPQILLLFFFLGLLEDSGYMARVAYLMDRIMRSMNLHGRAFVPMLSGFACAVPAIMATRTMERQRDRLLTMLVVPLMTCSARLPVYTLIIASLFPAQKVLGFLPVRGLLMVFMYAFGIVTALTAAAVLSRAIKPLKARRLPFVIELPPYRLPRLRDVLHMMWERSRQFLSEAGTVILACTIVLWVLLSFPREPAQPVAATSPRTIAAAPPAPSSGGARAAAGGRAHPAELRRPARPRDRAGAAAARLRLEDRRRPHRRVRRARGVRLHDGRRLRDRRRRRRAEPGPARPHPRRAPRPTGAPVYTPLVGLSLMVFFALSCQCMSTLAVVRRETGGLRWPLFLFGYMTVLAWVVSFVVYQGGRALGLS